MRLKTRIQIKVRNVDFNAEGGDVTVTYNNAATRLRQRQKICTLGEDGSCGWNTKKKAA
ncbi:hypothetical protein GCM10007854_28000 [Algimonas porphyrae]|uniref:Uncharacterized protein n=1 Tax=Algimonas porphyrae TaxID=1128113 RepID=A0ABQ5V593_9PROT|nr:hypothetical protein GCM10007854_28000 [Algimonas porphyrae]